MALNLQSYGSGSHPWGNLKPEYLEKVIVSVSFHYKRTQLLSLMLIRMVFRFFSQRGFVEAHCDDGLIELFGFKHGWHASFVMAELISAKHIAQVT